MSFRPLSLLITLLSMNALHAETAAPLPLWPGDAPGALGKTEHDIPTLTIYPAPADKANGTAIVICPGGGYGGLADHEGAGYANWLAENGVTGLVLKYRLGSKGYKHPVMLNDAARALRLTRHHAAKWNINPSRIGIMGSSAGGHLASTLLTHFDAGKTDSTDPIERESSRPDFGILCYPVVSMGPFTHGGSRTHLLGENPSQELMDSVSSEKQVKKDTPACFIWHTWDDNAVKVENALEFANALRKAGVRYDLHIYDRGPHGIGLSVGANGASAGEVHAWAKDLLFWMKQNGWLTK